MLGSRSVGIAVSPGPTAFAPLLYAGRLNDAVEAAASLGLTCLELSVRDAAELDAAAVRAQLESAGLACSAIATGQACLADGLCLASADPATRAGAIERFGAAAALAADLDAAVLMGSIRGRLATGGARRGDAVGAIRACVERASALGVTVLLETINRYETDFATSCQSALELLDEVAVPSFRLLLDTFHMNIEEARFGDAIRAAGERLGYVHVVDSNRLAPGLGHVDFDEVLAALDEIGYDGPLVAEILPEPDDETAAAAAAAFFARRGLVTAKRAS